jgi:hypothetical protein
VKVSWVRRAIVGESELREAGAKLAAGPGTTAATASLSNSSDDSAKSAAVQAVKKWWAGEGLNRRHRNFHSYLLVFVTVQKCLILNDRVTTASCAGVCWNAPE